MMGTGNQPYVVQRIKLGSAVYKCPICCTAYSSRPFYDNKKTIAAHYYFLWCRVLNWALGVSGDCKASSAIDAFSLWESSNSIRQDFEWLGFEQFPYVFLPSLSQEMPIECFLGTRFCVAFKKSPNLSERLCVCLWELGIWFHLLFQNKCANLIKKQKQKQSSRTKTTITKTKVALESRKWLP